MGHGAWNASLRASTQASYAAAGTNAFGYSNTVTKTIPRHMWKVHASLDPMGMAIRESRDSADHPTSLPIAILLDVTGSMSQVPKALQVELPNLLAHLQQCGYVEHPQILFGAIGDAISDRVPLQIGQFESDNRMDEHLSNILLEAGGGGSGEESYELGFYFLGEKTVTDSWEKRQEKGFAFIFGDEFAYPEVNHNKVIDLFGDGIQQNIPLGDVVAKAMQTWEIFFVIPQATYNGKNPMIYDYWSKMLGTANVIKMENVANVCDELGMTIAKRVIERKHTP